jgi:hypothetical protein
VLGCTARSWKRSPRKWSAKRPVHGVQAGLLDAFALSTVYMLVLPSEVALPASCREAKSGC